MSLVRCCLSTGSESIWLTAEIIEKISKGSSQAVAAFNEGICIESLMLRQNSSNDEAVKLRDYVKIWGLWGGRGELDLRQDDKMIMIEDEDRLKFVFSVLWFYDTWIGNCG